MDKTLFKTHKCGLVKLDHERNNTGKKVGRYDGVFPCDVKTLLTYVQQKLISGYHTSLVVYVACLHPFRPLLEKKKTLSSFFFFVNSMDHIPLATDKEPTGLLRSPLFEELVVHTR